MKTEIRDGKTWFIAETDQDRDDLTRMAKVLASQKFDHQFIYKGEPGQENPVVEELSY